MAEDRTCRNVTTSPEPRRSCACATSALAREAFRWSERAFSAAVDGQGDLIARNGRWISACRRWYVANRVAAWEANGVSSMSGFHRTAIYN